MGLTWGGKRITGRKDFTMNGLKGGKKSRERHAGGKNSGSLGGAYHELPAKKHGGEFMKKSQRKGKTWRRLKNQEKKNRKKTKSHDQHTSKRGKKNKNGEGTCMKRSRTHEQCRGELEVLD